MAKVQSRQSNGVLFRIFYVIGLIVILLGCVFGTVSIINASKTELLDSFRYENRSAVETMVSNINQLNSEYKAGALSEEQAKSLAVSMVQNGVWNDGRRGFWALDPDGTLLAKVENGDMSSKPGDNVWDYQDSDGRYIEREIIAVGQNGGGFIEFRVENDAVNDTYVVYALATDFGFIVDATFNMNYFEQHWDKSMAPVITQYAILVIVSLVLVLVLVASVNLFSFRKKK